MQVSTVNHSIKQFVQGVQSLPLYNKMSNVEVVKKVFQIAMKVILGWNLQTGTTHCAGLVKTLQVFCDVEDFYSAYHSLVFWLKKPLSSANIKIDRNHLENSLKTAFLTNDCVSSHFNNDEKEIKKYVESILKGEEEQNKKYMNLEEIKHSLQAIIPKGKDEYISTSERIIETIEIRQKSEIFAVLVIKVCLTINGVGGIVSKVQKWGVLELALQSVRMGDKIPLLAFISSPIYEGSLKSLGVFVSTVSIGVNSYQIACAIIKWNQANATDREVDQAKKELKEAGLRLAESTVSLGCTIAPLCFAFTPMTLLVVIPIISKTTGIMCALAA